MPMTKADELAVASLRTNEEFITRVTVAVSGVIADVFKELPATVDHEHRIKWAVRAMKSTRATAEAMFWAVVGYPSIRTSAVDPDAITEANIRNAVADVVTGLAEHARITGADV